jgi:hypothetical protein
MCAAGTAARVATAARRVYGSTTSLRLHGRAVARIRHGFTAARRVHGSRMSFHGCTTRVWLQVGHGSTASPRLHGCTKRAWLQGGAQQHSVATASRLHDACMVPRSGTAAQRRHGFTAARRVHGSKSGTAAQRRHGFTAARRVHGSATSLRLHGSKVCSHGRR